MYGLTTQIYHVSDSKTMSIAPSFKEEARRIIEELPDDASWEDLMYRIYVREAVKSGLRDVDQGRVVPDEEVRRQFGLQ